MTEQEWLNASDPMPLLNFLRKEIITLVDEAPEEQREKMRHSLSSLLGNRKRLLFACACCRTIWHLLEDERSRNTVEILEQCADGFIYPDTHRNVLDNAYAARDRYIPEPRDPNRFHVRSLRTAASAVCEAASYQLEQTVQEIVSAQMWSRPDLPYEFGIGKPISELTGLLRDIFGNPFRSIEMNSQWLTNNVLSLAQTIYEDRAFDRVLILYDALLDAGCNNEDILNHCQSTEPHVRGCWVVDLLLEKSDFLMTEQSPYFSLMRNWSGRN